MPLCFTRDLFFHLIVSGARPIGIWRSRFFHATRLYFTAIVSENVLLSNKSEGRRGEDHHILSLAEPATVAPAGASYMRYQHCLETHSRAGTNLTLKHDLLATTKSIDAQVNAKPMLDSDIYYRDDWHSLWMLIKSLRVVSACVCVCVYGLQICMHNNGEYSCTWCRANYTVKGSCECLLTVSPKWQMNNERACIIPHQWLYVPSERPCASFHVSYACILMGACSNCMCVYVWDSLIPQVTRIREGLQLDGRLHDSLSSLGLDDGPIDALL